jgi:hypothetical protein
MRANGIGCTDGTELQIKLPCSVPHSREEVLFAALRLVIGKISGICLTSIQNGTAGFLGLAVPFLT